MSNIQATQIKVTLPNELYMHLKSKADKFGLSLASYIRHLVVNDVKDLEIPVFNMSKHREEIALKSIEEHKAGKTKPLSELDEVFADL